jgi:NADPH-dependent 2,4-dienoyl-CoA reductase/sulfur reductase-like enzyme
LAVAAPHHVIVGNSIAGIEAAITLRNRDRSARITVISAEHPHPFARVSLMYVFCGQLSLKDTQFYPEDLYDRMRFERVNDRVVAVDAAQRTLQLVSGATLPFDTLLLAVGSTARKLHWSNAYVDPALPRFVHHFVTLSDLHALDAAAKPGMAVAVIGGGLIGVEAAEVLHQRGLKTHFLIREPWYFPVALDAQESGMVAGHIRGHGVDCQTDCTVQGLERVGSKVRLLGPELEVDLVVGAIGVEPATAFLANSGIALNPETGGVETRDNLESISCRGIFAAGDCAQVTWLDGSRRPEQLWYTSRDQGRLAAAAMVGDDVCYRRGTWYNSAKFFDVEYTTAGFLPPERTAAGSGWQTWFQRAPDRAVSQRIVVRNGAVKGFNGIGGRWDHNVWMQWIQQRRPLEWVLAHMNEARFDEEFTSPFTVLPSATLTEGA